MTFHMTHKRKLKAVELSVRMQALLPTKERHVEMDDIMADARKIEEWTREDGERRMKCVELAIRRFSLKAMDERAINVQLVLHDAKLIEEFVSSNEHLAGPT